MLVFICWLSPTPLHSPIPTTCSPDFPSLLVSALLSALDFCLPQTASPDSWALWFLEVFGQEGIMWNGKVIEKVEIFSFYSLSAPTPHSLCALGSGIVCTQKPHCLVTWPLSTESVLTKYWLFADYVITSSPLALGIVMASHCYWYLDTFSSLTGFVSLAHISVNSPFIKFQVKPFEWAIWFLWDIEWYHLFI